MPRLSEAIDEFSEARAGNGYAKNTLRNNKKDLVFMLRVLGNIDPRHIEPRHIDMVFGQAQRTMGPSACNNLMNSMSVFFKWCRSYRYMKLDHDPLYGRRPFKVARRERMRVPLADFPRLLEVAEAHHPRDRAAVALCLFLMVRQSELRSLRIRDLNLTNTKPTVRVTIHKTGLEQDMPVTARLERELRAWLTAYQEQAGPLQPDWYLIPSKATVTYNDPTTGKLCHERLGKLRPTRPISKPEDIAKRVLEGAGYPLRDAAGKATFEGIHTLRRSAARAVFDELTGQGYDGALRRVQSYLHHASSTMTERYLGLELDVEARNREAWEGDLYPSWEQSEQAGTVDLAAHRAARAGGQ